MSPTAILVDPAVDDGERRALLYDGHLVMFSPRPSTVALAAFARSCAEQAFAPLDPRSAPEMLAPERMRALVAAYQAAVSAGARPHIAAVLDDFDCDLDETWFADPQARVVVAPGARTTVQSRTYLPQLPPHRDTWYSGLFASLNWWLPVYDITADSGLAFYPARWSTPVPDGVARLRQFLRSADLAAPASGELAPEIRLACPSGGVILFSGAQLHATVPNTSGVARFSIDFRTLHMPDLHAGRGARHLDGPAETSPDVLDLFVRARDATPLAGEGAR